MPQPGRGRAQLSTCHCQLSQQKNDLQIISFFPLASQTFLVQGRVPSDLEVQPGASLRVSDEQDPSFKVIP